MTWQLTFSRNARRNLRRLPSDVRRRLDGVFSEMTRDPLSGDVVVLKGYPVGYRRRVGPYRVLFDIDRTARSVQIHDTVRRTSTTYRKAAVTDGELLDRIAAPDPPGRELLLRATERMHLTARGYHRVLRVARTIADLDGAAQIRRAHIAEALSFRRMAPERR